MSYITYNGIQLGVIQTRKVVEEPITLGQQVGGTRRTVTVLATVHTNTAGIRIDVPEPQVGVIAPDGAAAYVAIRNRLMQQRRAFEYVVGNVVIANFPATVGTDLNPGPNRPTRFQGDPELGPKPLACNVVQFNGTGTAVVEYTIQWADKLCLDHPNQAVLAHVWKCDDDISETYFLTRTYQGRVTFDPRVVGGASGTLGIHPDRVRGLLLPTKATGFIRERVLIQSSEDMKTLDYTVVDRQPQAFVNSSAVPKIQATHSIVNSLPSFRERAQAVASQLGAVGAPDRARGDRGLEGAGTIGARLAPALNNGFGVLNLLGGMSNFVAAGYSAIPLATHTVEVTAYGAPATAATEVARAARVIALWRLMKGTQIADPGLGVPDYGGSCTQQDSSDPFATTVRIEVVSRPLTMDPANPNPLWNLGQNTMVRFAGDIPPVPVDEQIVSRVGNNPVPLSIKQLMYGGSFQGRPGDWGWAQSGGFAADLMSNRDYNFRGSVNNGILGTGSPFTLMLLQTLQEVCSNTTETASFISTAPLKEWPK